jgi:hypothetical protein
MTWKEPQMAADERRYKHQALTRKIIGVFFGPRPQVRRLAFSNQRKRGLLYSQTDLTAVGPGVTEPHLRSSAFICG